MWLIDRIKDAMAVNTQTTHNYTYEQRKPQQDSLTLNTAICGWGEYELQQIVGDKYKPYFIYCEKLMFCNESAEKIYYAEKSLELLPDILDILLRQYNQIPSSIPAKRILPKEYIRLAHWKKAEQTIIKLAKAKAYTEEETIMALQYLTQYKHSAEIAVKFLLSHGGFLQRNIYDELLNTDADRECLKAFTRSSYLIDKVRVKGTNKLYINQNVLSQSDMKNIICNGIIA